MKKYWLPIFFIALSHYAVCQRYQDPDPAIFFGAVRDTREAEKIRALNRPDSADIYAIFTDSFAKKALWYSNYWYATHTVPDTLGAGFKNVVFKETEVRFHTLRIFEEYEWYDKRKAIFRNRDMKFYRIARGDGYQWAYTFANRFYVNNKWIVIENPESMIYYALHD